MRVISLLTRHLRRVHHFYFELGPDEIVTGMGIGLRTGSGTGMKSDINGNGLGMGII